jgi:radical SAM protein with 4Fe4S-binding SPASM domain
MASHGCSAGRDTAVISPQGFVRRCAALSEIYGNLLEEDLTTIWKRINNVKKVVNSTCADCMPGEYCYGGCEARVLAEGKERYVCGLDECKKTGFIENLIKKELIYSQQ